MNPIHAAPAPSGLTDVDSSRNGNGNGDAPRAAAHQMLYLAGRPTLKRFIRYVQGHALNPPAEREITASWKRSEEVVRKLQREEAGIADDAHTQKLGPEYQPLLEKLVADPLIRGGFNSVPSDIALVELDKLVVYQKHIDLRFARDLALRLGPSPDTATVFRTCLQLDRSNPPVKWARIGGGKFVFVSPSNDLRSLGFIRLDPAQVVNSPPPGNAVGIVGVAVGFGSNFLNVIRSEGRLVLNNGSHRAFALRNVGVTHVPCIVQHAATREELRLVGDSTISDDADFYFHDPRPTMLRDYFDDRVRIVMDSAPRNTEVRVTIEVEENWLPAF